MIILFNKQLKFMILRGSEQMNLNLNRENALKAFETYVNNYDTKSEKIRLKIEHTYRVAGLCQQIALSAGFDENDVNIAWLTGLLHDVGRFEQLRRYGTFIDAESIDHAEFGADLLFKEGLVRNFTEDDSLDDLLEKAVRYHSAYRIPENFTGYEKKFANLLRDADKIDILKVNVDFPLEEIYNVTTEELKNCTVTKEVMEAFNEEHAVLRSLKKTPVDNVVGHISLMYELTYPVSYKLVQQQGFLDKLMDFNSNIPETNEQFEQIRAKMTSYINAVLSTL
jgi:HD superfamily phosphohydrolase YqeK